MLTLDIKDLRLNIAQWENLNSIIQFVFVNQLDEEFVHLYRIIFLVVLNSLIHAGEWMWAHPSAIS
jgi:hypothetical protein